MPLRSAFAIFVALAASLQNAMARLAILNSAYEPRFQPRTICLKSTVPSSASSTLPSRNGLFLATV